MDESSKESIKRYLHIFKKEIIFLKKCTCSLTSNVLMRFFTVNYFFFLEFFNLFNISGRLDKNSGFQPVVREIFLGGFRA